MRQISFEYVQQALMPAADRLSLMCFFDRQGIPEALLRLPPKREQAKTDQRENEEDDDDDGEGDSEDDMSQSSASDDQLEHGIVALRNLSLLTEATRSNFSLE
ncbi:hypothetical protein NX059_012230 [Plenodomus lindquistii]|nr:hypothetical protein NX059_012230 [Plenodomus lindquistii]